MNGHAHARADAHHADAHADENDDPGQPGGGRVQTEQPEIDPANAPPQLRHHQLTATVSGYRAAAIAYGIPFR